MSGNVKRRLISGFLLLVLFTGLLLLFYPAIADYVNTFRYHMVIRDYQKQVAKLDRNVYEDVLAAAEAYNADFAADTSVISLLSDEKRAVYESMLNITGSGLMGYIEIPKVNIFLPIYHGTSDAVLNMGIGHFEGSSLPVGGESANTVLSGHSGLPSSKLFTDIDQLDIGDTFSLHVLSESFYYRVDSIEHVEPEALNDLHIEKGKDYCTLTTCWPYGVNSHRLVVRGVRFEVEEEKEAIEQEDDRLASIPNPVKFHPELLVIPSVVVACLIVFAIVWFVRSRRSLRRSRNSGYGK